MGATSDRIVVGVDGSAASRAALRWALDEARIRHGSVDVVHAWQFPALGLSHFGGVSLPAVTFEYLEEVAHEVVLDAIDTVAGPRPAVPVSPVVRLGHPADVLVAESKGAALVVIGARGLGGRASVVLGSVSTAVLHHARCPVVVIHDPDVVSAAPAAGE